MPINAQQARHFYDRYGAVQDRSARFEDRARELMVELGAFERATRVLEFGFGTGRLAQLLFEGHLREDARYVGQEVSSTMCDLARSRLGPWGERVELRLTEGELDLPDADASFDRFVSTYVLDLMPEPGIRRVLDEAHRVLTPEGLLCLVSLTRGERPLSRAISRMWGRISHLAPTKVGGCRPVELGDFVRPPAWEIVAKRVVTALAVPSQVVIARKLAPQA